MRNPHTIMTIGKGSSTIAIQGFGTWVPTLLVKEGVSMDESIVYVTLGTIGAPLGALIASQISDYGTDFTAVCLLCRAGAGSGSSPFSFSAFASSSSRMRCACSLFPFVSSHFGDSSSFLAISGKKIPTAPNRKINRQP